LFVACFEVGRDKSDESRTEESFVVDTVMLARLLCAHVTFYRELTLSPITFAHVTPDPIRAIERTLYARAIGASRSIDIERRSLPSAIRRVIASFDAFRPKERSAIPARGRTRSTDSDDCLKIRLAVGSRALDVLRSLRRGVSFPLMGVGFPFAVACPSETSTHGS